MLWEKEGRTAEMQDLQIAFRMRFGDRLQGDGLRVADYHKRGQMTLASFPWMIPRYTTVYVDDEKHGESIAISVPGIIQAMTLAEAKQLRDSLNESIKDWESQMNIGGGK